ncbi:hypothetical protein [Plasmodium yoelii yoelii]|uniref:Uncharacterized protein n=1 Tax=Plasmodium yoelii yoelii TaxID=73239 RepID=Q7RLW9_PLAYO|nr:hypothetical protein [Plasmodium yoelii yoelii]
MEFFNLVLHLFIISFSLNNLLEYDNNNNKII